MQRAEEQKIKWKKSMTIDAIVLEFFLQKLKLHEDRGHDFMA